MLTDKAHGTQTATINTEHALVSGDTTPGVWGLRVNTKNMQNGDEIELRAYTKILTGDADPSLVLLANYRHAQGDGAAPGAGTTAQGEVVKDSPPVFSLFAVTWTLKQIAGTGRDFDWQAVTY